MASHPDPAKDQKSRRGDLQRTLRELDDILFVLGCLIASRRALALPAARASNPSPPPGPARGVPGLRTQTFLC